MNAPCKDCPDRKPGCHSVCERYLDYRRNKDEQIEAHLRELDSTAVEIPRFKRKKGRRDRHG